MKEVYILVTDWAVDFDNNSEVKVYSTREKAKAAYDIEVKTEKFTDSMCEGCFDGEGNFIEDNNEDVCCDEFAVADEENFDGESFSVYREGWYQKDHFTVYYRKINLDA